MKIYEIYYKVPAKHVLKISSFTVYIYQSNTTICMTLQTKIPDLYEQEEEEEEHEEI